MSIYGFSCSTFPVCSLIYLSFLPAVCDFLLTCFSSPRYSPVFLSLGFPHVWCPVLFVFTPRSPCLLLDSEINKYCTISWSPRSLLPSESVTEYRTETVRSGVSPPSFLFSRFEKFFVSCFSCSHGDGSRRPASSPLPTEISLSPSIRGSSAGLPRRRH